jgi:hypothetical protein
MHQRSHLGTKIPQIKQLIFKCNGSGIQFKSIQFSQEYSNQRNVRKKSKDKIRTQNVTKFGFTLIELGTLYKNGLPSLSVTRVTTHLK